MNNIFDFVSKSSGRGIMYFLSPIIFIYNAYTTISLAQSFRIYFNSQCYFMGIVPSFNSLCDCSIDGYYEMPVPYSSCDLWDCLLFTGSLDRTGKFFEFSKLGLNNSYTISTELLSTSAAIIALFALFPPSFTYAIICVTLSFA